VPDDVKTEVGAGVADVKKALEADDLDAIKRSTEHLSTVSQKMGEAMYAASAASADATSSTGSASAGEAGTNDDEVVDAEIVDEPGEGGSQ
jgi:molecular chaperone DnaK